MSTTSGFTSSDDSEAQRILKTRTQRGTPISKHKTVMLDKNSASPTIMIVSKINTSNVIAKVWFDNNQLLQTRGLVYESEMYDKLINPMSKKFAVFLKYHSRLKKTSVRDLLKIFGVKLNTTEGIMIIKALIILHDKNPSRFNYSDHKSINNYFKVMNYTTVTLASKMQYMLSTPTVSCIILPMLENFSTFSAILDDESTDTVLKLIKQVIIGIYLLHTEKIVHNDLHSGNILIINKTRVQIFDWDRSYSPRLLVKEFNMLNKKLGPTGNTTTRNILLGPICKRSGMCNSISSYPRDLLKILHYILKKRTDYKTILGDIFGIMDKSVAEMIRNIAITDSFYKRTGSNGRKYSILADDSVIKFDNNPIIKFMIKHLGPIHKIMENVVDKKLSVQDYKKKLASVAEKYTEVKAMSQGGTIPFSDPYDKMHFNFTMVHPSKRVVHTKRHHMKTSRYGRMMGIYNKYKNKTPSTGHVRMFRNELYGLKYIKATGKIKTTNMMRVLMENEKLKKDVFR